MNFSFADVLPVKVLMSILYSSASQTVCLGRFAGVPRANSKSVLLLQIFCQNRENATITGHGERFNNLFFWKSATYGAASRDFWGSWPRKVLISKKIKKRSLSFSLSPVMLLDINWNRFQGCCAAKFVELISCAGRQKSLGNNALQHCNIIPS